MFQSSLRPMRQNNSLVISNQCAQISSFLYLRMLAQVFVVNCCPVFAVTVLKLFVAVASVTPAVPLVLSDVTLPTTSEVPDCEIVPFVVEAVRLPPTVVLPAAPVSTSPAPAVRWLMIKSPETDKLLGDTVPPTCVYARVP